MPSGDARPWSTPGSPNRTIPDRGRRPTRCTQSTDDRAVATGYSRYLATDEAPQRTWHNCFLLRFDDDGRCAEFTEFYMEEPPPGS